MLNLPPVAARRRLAGDDSGFTLVEVVVALTVLMIFASAIMVTLLNGLKVSKQARQRVAASNLASREIEIVRNRFATDGASALAVAAETSVTNQNSTAAAGQPSVVDGVPYTVKRTVAWQPTGTGETACDGGSAVNYPALKISVQVTWPNMGTAKPVHAETVTTPLKTQLDDVTLAFIAVKVQNSAGTIAPYVPVVATGPGGTFNQTTDSSGCAVFQVNTVGSYSLTLNTTGWVDQTGLQTSVKTGVSVTAGGITQAMMTYDRAGGMDIKVDVVGGYVMPTPMPMVNYTQPNVAAATSRRSFASAGSVTPVTGLWPGSYSAWAGGCPDSDPAGTPTAGTRVAPVIVGPGMSAPITVTLAPINITAKVSLTGALIADQVVTATSASATACATADKVLTLGRTGTDGTLRASLPYGVWKLTITNPATGSPMVTSSSNLQPLASGATTYTLRAS